MRQQRLWKRFTSVLLSGFMVLSGITLFPVTASADPGTADASTVTWVMTREGDYWNEQPDLTTTQWEEESKSDLYIDVDETITYQQMAENVWGGCFNERGWKYLNELPEADKNHILDLLFDPEEEDGLHLTLARMPIGSSDFAIDLYSLDDTEDDYDLKDFSIERDKSETGIIPYIKEALKRQPDLKIWASPWSPPYWMKDNRNKIGGHIVYNEQNMACYAKYFGKFIEAYRAEGIDVYMVSPQNEPTMNTAYSSCVWTGEQLRDFIRDYLGPEMERLGVEIYLGTFTNSSDKLIDPTLNDPEARNYISGITFQWWSYLKAHSLYESGFDLGMMQSETMCGDGNNNWAYAENQFDLMWMYLESGISAYNLWNMVLEWDGVTPGGHNTAANPWPQNAPITVNETTKEYTINPQYYEYKHFTEYIQPGARRISSTGTYDAAFPLKDGEADNRYTEPLHEIAFRNPDGSNVLLVKNGSNETKHVDINFNGRKVSADIPAHSINTFTTAGTPLTGTETDMRESIPEDKIVRLTNKGTGQALCIEGDGGVVNDTSHIFQWTYGGEANQQWYLEPSKVGDTDTVKLVNIKSGKIVAVDGGNKNAGAKLILWPYAGEANQNWIVEEADNGYCRFKNADSGHYLAGDAASWAEQRSLDQSDETQLWKIEYLAEETAPTKKEVAAFEAEIEEAKALNPNAYTADSYAAVQAALQAAQQVDKTNRAAVRKAAKALEEALQALVAVAQLDKQALETAIANASSKVQNDYTAESWQKLQAALAEAKRIKEDAAATQDEIDAAVQNLNDAVTGLVLQKEPTTEADKRALETAIANASSKAQSDYTTESWQKLQTALAKANKVNKDAAATQEDVNAAEKELNDALSALVVVTPAAEIGIPTAVKAVWSGGKKVKVTWEQAANADTYEVYRSYKKNSGFAKLASVKGTSYTDTKATTGKTAYYKVIACAGTKKSAYSTAASLYVLKAPTGLKSKAAKGAVTISFGKVKNASGYEIYRAAKKNGTYKKVAVLKSAKTVKKKLKLKQGKYFFKVRAYQTVNGKKQYTGYSKVLQAKAK